MHQQHGTYLGRSHMRIICVWVVALIFSPSTGSRIICVRVQVHTGMIWCIHIWTKTSFFLLLPSRSTYDTCKEAGPYAYDTGPYAYGHHYNFFSVFLFFCVMARSFDLILDSVSLSTCIRHATHTKSIKNSQKKLKL